MAQKRMLSLSVCDTDWFLDLPLSAQALYFHLNLRADDDGFIDNPKSIVRKTGANQNDLDLLLAKRFLLKFDSGVLVIKHWRMHNTLQKDRYTPTQFQEEFNSLELKKNKSYTEKSECIQNGNILETKCFLSLDSKPNTNINTNYIINSNTEKEENNIKEEKHKYGQYGRILLTDKQYSKLCKDHSKAYIDKVIDAIDEYVQMNGNKNKYKDFNLVIQKAIREKWSCIANITIVDQPEEQEEDINIEESIGDL